MLYVYRTVTVRVVVTVRTAVPPVVVVLPIMMILLSGISNTPATTARIPAMTHK